MLLQYIKMYGNFIFPLLNQTGSGRAEPAPRVSPFEKSEALEVFSSYSLGGGTCKFKQEQYNQDMKYNNDVLACGGGQMSAERPSAKQGSALRHLQPLGKNHKGLTLIEILIALVIIVGLMGSSLSFMNRRENHIRKTFRAWTALNRQLDYQARLKGQQWRWAIDLDKNTYWVEKRVSETQQDSQLSSTTESSNSSDTSADLETSKNMSYSENSDSKVSPEAFVIDKAFFEKPQTLPKKFSFESMELSHQKKIFMNGYAYIYYLPEGQFSTTLVLIKHKKNYRSVFFNRLTGDMTVFSGKKSLKDLEQ